MNNAVELMNKYGNQGTPFLFIIDFDFENPVVRRIDEIVPDELLFNIAGNSNSQLSYSDSKKNVEIDTYPVTFERYQKAFSNVQQHINHGDSFLLNLTMPTKITTNLTLKEIFHRSNAKYNLWYNNEFVVFSPETFITIKDNKISSFPMKGTMDASLPNAEQKLQNSEKELAEHYTIVDLIRNDLSIVATDVKVSRFKYVEELKTHRGGLLQMSSEIEGKLRKQYQKNIGDLLAKILPAGSITGAPKKKTVEIIKDSEKYVRGYYTGVAGIFDGENLDSFVMIRFIEKSPQGLVYKSGGGITSQSKVDDEYRELKDKVYIPE